MTMTENMRAFTEYLWIYLIQNVEPREKIQIPSFHTDWKWSSSYPGKLSMGLQEVWFQTLNFGFVMVAALTPVLRVKN